MMAREKRVSAKIKRRSPGLVITPPAPRPTASDHPARLLFREAIESAKSAPEPKAADAGTSAGGEGQQVEPEGSSVNLTTATVKVVQSEPLQIFKELKARPDPVRAPAAAPQNAEPQRKHAETFAAHFGQWRPFLAEAQMCVLEALYNMTHAQGVDHCLTSMPKLASAAGISERQTYNVVKELEKCGFVERPDTYNTPTKKGTIFRLHLSRQTSSLGVNRRYHYGD